VAKKSKQARYEPLRPHTARIIKLGQYPLHVNGGYLDDPERIPQIDGRQHAADK
jgi:alpha-D-ribose 1-methylphosphonate 5-phosphate C-P lyase